MNNIIKYNQFCFKVKWGNKYIWPNEWYKDNFYSKKSIPDLIKEIEEEYPKYKGRVKAFQMTLLKVK